MSAALEILKKASASSSAAPPPAHSASGATPAPSIPVPTLGARKPIVPPPTVAPKVKQTILKFADAEFTEDDRRVLLSVYASHTRANDGNLRPESREHILVLTNTIAEESADTAVPLDRQHLFIFIKPFSDSGAFIRLDSPESARLYGVKTLTSTLELATTVLGNRFWGTAVRLLQRSIERFIGVPSNGSIAVAPESVATYDELANHYLEHVNSFSLHKQLGEAERTGKIGVCARRAIRNTSNAVTFACMAHPKMTGHFWVARYRLEVGPSAPAPAPASRGAVTPVVNEEAPAKATEEAAAPTAAKEDQVMSERAPVEARTPRGDNESGEGEEEESLVLEGDIHPQAHDGGEEEEGDNQEEVSGGAEDGEEQDNEAMEGENVAGPEPVSVPEEPRKAITWDPSVKEPRGAAVRKAKRSQSAGGGRRKPARTEEEVEARREERRAKDRESQRIKRAREREEREIERAKKESLASSYLAQEVEKAERAKEKEIAARQVAAAATGGGDDDDFESDGHRAASKRARKAPAAAAALPTPSTPKRGKRARSEETPVVHVDMSDDDEEGKKNANGKKAKDAEEDRARDQPPSISGEDSRRRASPLSIPFNIFAKPRYEVKIVRDAAGRPSRPIRFVMQDDTVPPTVRTILTPELGPAAGQVRFELESADVEPEEIERIMAIVQRPLVNPLARGPGYWYFAMQASKAGDIIVEDCGRAVLITDDSPARTLKGPELLPYIDDISAIYAMRGIGHARQQLEAAHHSGAPSR